MKKRHDIERIVKVLEEIHHHATNKTGVNGRQVCDKYGVNYNTMDKWRGKGLDYYKKLLMHLEGGAQIGKPKYSTTLAIPDLHCPFHHQDALEFLKAVRNRFKPTTVVCLGDEIDAHALSRYPKDPDGMAAGEEVSKAREALYPFYKEFPEVLVCESNHTVRGHKIAFGSGIPSAFLRTIEQILNVPDGWKYANKHEVDGVLYIHGDSGKSGCYAHVNYMRAFKQSIVIGHIHSYAGVNYEGTLFGMNSGCLIDSDAYCFKYAKNMPIPVNLGCGIIIDGKEAHFIPMHLDGHKRWTGKL